MIGFAASVVIIKLPAPVSASAQRSFPAFELTSFRGQKEQVNCEAGGGKRAEYEVSGDASWEWQSRGGMWATLSGLQKSKGVNVNAALS